MTHKKLLVTGTLSTLLLASSLFAQEDCPTCRVNLKNLKPKRVVSTKSEFKTHPLVITRNSYDIVVNGEVTVVFVSYTMTAEEKAKYYKEQQAIALNRQENEEANKELKIIIKPIEKIEDKILNKNLPTSEYFCDNDKKPIYIKDSDLYECV